MSTKTSKPSATESPMEYSERMTFLTTFYANDLLNLLHPYIVNAKTILDVGCGTGGFAFAYIQQYANGIEGQTIISSDISQKNLEIAKPSIQGLLKTKPKNYHTKFKFQIEDETQLSGIKDGSIDIVIGINSVSLIPNQTDTLLSIHRVLQPNHGIFANVAWVRPSLSVSEHSSTATSNIIMDPCFGGNFHSAMFRMNLTLMDFMNFALPPSFYINNDDINDKKPVMLEWAEPNTIEQNLTKCNFHRTKTYRTAHSMAWCNIDMVIDMCLQNPNIKSYCDKLSDEQYMTLKRKLFDASLLDQDEELRGGNNIGENEIQPCTMWTASNITITHV
jgi:ubiquinone/menaquinone biosynthesis C-methylase UbiE